MRSPWRAVPAGVLLLLATVGASAQTEKTVAVSNTTMVVNGDTTDIPSLIANPGGDGISFLEAFQAANGTAGVKRIEFDPSMRGKTIEVTPTSDLREFAVHTPDLSIDGDIDGDLSPDVTLHASNNLMLFIIRDSRFSLRNLRLETSSSGVVISTQCQDIVCAENEIDGISITGNIIINGAIEISPGVIRTRDLPFLAPLSYKNIQISRNEISASDFAINLMASVDGADLSELMNVSIDHNKITAATGVRVVAADRAAPPFFGEANVIEGLKIDQNEFSVRQTAIVIEGGTQGNSDNRITGVEITNNEIKTPNSAIDLAAAAEPKPQRVGSGNLIENVLISGNEITATARGITVSAADLPVLQRDSVGLDSNVVRNVQIHDNTVMGYAEAGIRLWGGLANLANGSLTISRNTLESVTIADNVLTAGSRSAVGIAAVGGESRAGSTARDNSIRALLIRGNRLSGHKTGILLVGGLGGQARSNSIVVSGVYDNTFDGNDVSTVLSENSDNSGGNSIRFPRRRAVR